MLKPSSPYDISDVETALLELCLAKDSIFRFASTEIWQPKVMEDQWRILNFLGAFLG